MPPAPKHVLVVDDEQRITELITRWLQPPRYCVTAADTATDALAVVADDSPDLIIVDKVLPLHSGLWLANEIRQRWNNTLPVILISGAEFTSDERRQFEALGNAIYLEKPFSRHELDSALARLL